MDQPDVEFAKFFIRKFYSGSITKGTLEDLTPLVQKGFRQFIDEGASSEKPRSALEEATQTEKKEAEEEAPPEIITTEDELRGFRIVQAILGRSVPVDKITYKDYKGHFSVLYEEHAWKWICRFRFDAPTKTVDIRDKEGKEERIPIKSVESLYDLADRLEVSLEFAIHGKKEEDEDTSNMN